MKEFLIAVKATEVFSVKAEDEEQAKQMVLKKIKPNSPVDIQIIEELNK